MKFFVYLLLFIVLVGFGLSFSLKNPQIVELSYYPDIMITAPIVVVLLVTLLLGALIGVLVMSLSRFSRRRELNRAKREVKKLTEQVEDLRSSSDSDAE